MRASLFVLVVALVGCGGATPPSPATPGTTTSSDAPSKSKTPPLDPANPLPVVPMRLVKTGTPGGTLTLKEDGTIWDDRHVVWRVKGAHFTAGDEALVAMGMTTDWEVKPDGKIVDHGTEMGHFTDDAALVSLAGDRRFYVEDSGALTFAPSDPAAAKLKTIRFEGFDPRARRLAEVMAFQYAILGR